MASSGYELKPEISGKQETINIVLWTRDVLKGAPSFGLTNQAACPRNPDYLSVPACSTSTAKGTVADCVTSPTQNPTSQLPRSLDSRTQLTLSPSVQPDVTFPLRNPTGVYSHLGLAAV
jgi:hypothetical protein